MVTFAHEVHRVHPFVPLLPGFARIDFTFQGHDAGRTAVSAGSAAGDCVIGFGLWAGEGSAVTGSVEERARETPLERFVPPMTMSAAGSQSSKTTRTNMIMAPFGKRVRVAPDLDRPIPTRIVIKYNVRHTHVLGALPVLPAVVFWGTPSGTQPWRKADFRPLRHAVLVVGECGAGTLLNATVWRVVMEHGVGGAVGRSRARCSRQLRMVSRG